MKSKRILMLNYEFPPLGGGAGNATYYLLKEFSKYKDLQIDLVTSSTDKFKIKKFSRNITIHFLDINKKGNFHYQSQKDLLTYSRKALKYCKQLIKQKNQQKKSFDLIHAFFGIPCGYIAMRLKKQYNIPYIVSLRGSDVPGHNPKFALLDKLIFRRLSKKVWKNAKEVIVNSKDLKKEAENVMNLSFKIISNGVDNNFYRKLKVRKPKRFRILYVGRLSKVKGIDYLINALSKINDKNVELIIVGEGDQKQSLVNLANQLKISNKIIYTGILNKDKLVREYSKADVFVLPSLHEGMSNTILEAMSCSLPIIATNTGGAVDIIKGNGMIVQQSNIIALKEAIDQMIKDKDLRSKIGKQSRKLAEQLSWDKTAIEYEELYLKC